jgi:hypothetical protein
MCLLNIRKNSTQQNIWTHEELSKQPTKDVT